MTEGSLGDSGGGELGLILARPMLAGPPQVPSDPLTLSLSCPFLAVCLREYPADTPASAEMKPGDLGHRVHGNVLCLLGKPSAQILLLSSLTTSRGMLWKPRETLSLAQGQAWVLLRGPGEPLVYLLLPLKG